MQGLSKHAGIFSFSPKGDEITYGSTEGKGGIYLAKSNGTNRRKLTPVGSYRRERYIR